MNSGQTKILKTFDWFRKKDGYPIIQTQAEIAQKDNDKFHYFLNRMPKGYERLIVKNKKGGKQNFDQGINSFSPWSLQHLSQVLVNHQKHSKTPSQWNDFLHLPSL